MRPTFMLTLSDVIWLGLLALGLLWLAAIYLRAIVVGIWEGLSDRIQGARRHWRDEGGKGPWDGKKSWRDDP